MSESAIQVKATDGNNLSGATVDAGQVVIASDTEIEAALENRIQDIDTIVSGGIEDPTMKHCSRCVKKGRVAYHPVNQFSTLKNGKLHSQCKVCRTEQSNEWCQRRKEHRKAYHQEYRQRMKDEAAMKLPSVLTEAPAPAPVKEETDIPDVFKGMEGLESLFVAYTSGGK